MIFRSIRWRLQIWYGLMLLAVLAGFGFTAYRLERGRQFRELDEQLNRRTSVLMAALGSPLRRPGPPERDLRPGPDDDLPEGPLDGPPGRFPPDRPRGLPGPEGRRELPGNFHLSPAQAAFFDDSDTNGFYFV